MSARQSASTRVAHLIGIVGPHHPTGGLIHSGPVLLQRDRAVDPDRVRVGVRRRVELAASVDISDVHAARTEPPPPKDEGDDRDPDELGQLRKWNSPCPHSSLAPLPNGSRLSCGRNARRRKAVEPQKKRLASEGTQFFPTWERPPASSAC